jgi:putative peptidoglycan lipid II flippase
VKNLFTLLTTRQTSILSGAVVIMATVILSKILGLVRNRLLVHIFPPNSTDVFFASLQLPDLIFQLLILGALAVAFIPVFTEYLEREGKSEAFEVAKSILNVSLITLGILSILIFIFAEPAVSLMFPGFPTEKKIEAVSLTRIVIFGEILLTIGSLFIGMLQSFQRFIIPALAGLFYNLGIILGIIFLSGPLGIKSAAIGVVIGAMLHIAIQIPLIKSLGFTLTWPKRLVHPGVKEVVRLMSMRSIGLAAEQINEKVGLGLSSLLSAGSLTYLTFAQSLQIVPIGLFGAALAQAALPVLSSEKSRGRIEEFKLTLLTTMHQILFLCLPAAAILIVLRIPVVRLVFGASQFDWQATVLTGNTLAYLAIGLSSQAICLLLVRGFYALKDTKTPVIVSLSVVALNIVLSLYFILGLHLDIWSIGLANSISAVASGVLLFGALHFKVGKFDLELVLVPLAKMLMATIIMGVALYIPIKLLDQVIFDTTRTVNLFILTGLSSVFALSIYITLVWFLKVRELETFSKLTRDMVYKLYKTRSKIKTEEIISETGQL